MTWSEAETSKEYEMKFVTFLLSLILIGISAIAWSGLDWNGGWAIYTKSFYQGKIAIMISVTFR
jgi:hypothetical protein